jgi:hypothetical protein
MKPTGMLQQRMVKGKQKGVGVGNCSPCRKSKHGNTELAIYALEQVHCWGTYFRARTGQFENFTHLNF